MHYELDNNVGVPIWSPTFFPPPNLSKFDWPIAKISWNYGGSPKIEDSMERWRASPFGPPIEVRREGLWAKHGIKVRCYWEQPWGTNWEPIGNLKGTC
jgi:hypothetical protein